MDKSTTSGVEINTHNLLVHRTSKSWKLLVLQTVYWSWDNQNNTKFRHVYNTWTLPIIMLLKVHLKLIQEVWIQLCPIITQLSLLSHATLSLHHHNFSVYIRCLITSHVCINKWHLIIIFNTATHFKMHWSIGPPPAYKFYWSCMEFTGPGPVLISTPEG